MSRTNRRENRTKKPRPYKPAASYRQQARDEIEEGLEWYEESRSPTVKGVDSCGKVQQR